MLNLKKCTVNICTYLAGLTERAGTTPGARMSSSSVAYAPHTAEKGDAIASKVGCHLRRTVATTAAGLSNCWCILMASTRSGGSAAAGLSSQRRSPRRPPALRARTQARAREGER